MSKPGMLMTKLHLSFAVTVALFFGMLAVPAAQQGPGPSEAAARAFLGLLAKGDFAGARKYFDADMLKLMPQEKLAALWKFQIEQGGPFQKLDKATLKKKDDLELVTVTCVFAKANVDASVVFKDKKIITLFLGKAVSTVAYAAPPYVTRNSFTEINVTVSTGEWATGGTLSVPKGTGPFPAVVLSQGSGPHDRDETAGPNKPHKDIAWGLAPRGIAVLRFDRRALTHGAKVAAIIDNFTVKEEVIDDVNAAVALLKARQDIDPARIFLLGHSLGAMLAPRIALGNADIQGLILMAGAVRPLHQLVLDQAHYLASFQGPLSDQDKAALQKIKEQVDRVSDPKLSPEVPAKDLVLGMPARYWLSMRGDSPAEAAKKLARPMLIMQGERDYQVKLEEFQLWKKALADRNDVTFKSYPRLNHMFLEGAGVGKSHFKEYDQLGHVPVEVVEDIAGWVKAQKQQSEQAVERVGVSERRSHFAVGERGTLAR